MAPSFQTNDGPHPGPSSTSADIRPRVLLDWTRELRARLPKKVFEPVPARLAWLPVHWMLVVFELYLLTRTSSLLPRLGLSLLLGASFAGLAFVAHEALHGALSRRRSVRYLAGTLGFLPFCLSPTLWVAWHNRVHHRNTNVPGVDPDCLATEREYAESRAVRLSTFLQTRSFGLFTLLVGFTIQSLTVLLRSKRLGYVTAHEHKLAWAQTFSAVVFWGGVGTWTGFHLFFWAYVLPLMIGNAIVMAHIVTNHGQMPLDEGAGPVATSLSVTVPRWFSFYTLDFGFHVEHHLLPTVSHRYGPLIREVLLDVAKESYLSMPLTKALAAFFRNLRIYADAHTLVDPLGGERAKTLGQILQTAKTSPPPQSALAPPNKKSERPSREPPSREPPSRLPLSRRPSPAH
jgi:fatty acid desaturase